MVGGALGKVFGAIRAGNDRISSLSLPCEGRRRSRVPVAVLEAQFLAAGSAAPASWFRFSSIFIGLRWRCGLDLVIIPSSAQVGSRRADSALAAAMGLLAGDGCLLCLCWPAMSGCPRLRCGSAPQRWPCQHGDSCLAWGSAPALMSSTCWLWQICMVLCEALHSVFFGAWRPSDRSWLFSMVGVCGWWLSSGMPGTL